MDLAFFYIYTAGSFDLGRQRACDFGYERAHQPARQPPVRVKERAALRSRYSEREAAGFGASAAASAAGSGFGASTVSMLTRRPSTDTFSCSRVTPGTSNTTLDVIILVLLVAAALPARAQDDDAILLVAHLDVVPANREDWSVDPFQLLEKDGYFYARGSGDDNTWRRPSSPT